MSKKVYPRAFIIESEEAANDRAVSPLPPGACLLERIHGREELTAVGHPSFVMVRVEEHAQPQKGQPGVLKVRSGAGAADAVPLAHSNQCPAFGTAACYVCMADDADGGWW